MQGVEEMRRSAVPKLPTVFFVLFLVKITRREDIF